MEPQGTKVSVCGQLKGGIDKPILPANGPSSPLATQDGLPHLTVSKNVLHEVSIEWNIL